MGSCFIERYSTSDGQHLGPGARAEAGGQIADQDLNEGGLAMATKRDHRMKRYITKVWVFAKEAGRIATFGLIQGMTLAIGAKWISGRGRKSISS